MNSSEIIKKFEKMRNEKNREGMARFGINTEKAFGIPIPVLRKTAKEIGKNHFLALELWKTGYHEARLLAGFIDDYKQVSEEQIEEWAKDFDSWDVCDQVCSNLFDKTPFAFEKAVELSARKEEFAKRTGFVLMACLSVHDKKMKDKEFEKFFPIIKREAHDERNFVKKAVNWALRQIGKRNLKLNKKAIVIAKQIEKMDSKSAKWIAKNALAELESKAVKKRLLEKN